MLAKAVKKNLSIGKVFKIVEAMAENGNPMRLQDIAAKVKQPASTTLRFLSTLIDRGYADQNRDNLQYYLTLKFCRLGEKVFRQVKIRNIIRPYLEELSKKFKEATSLAIEQKMNIVYVEVVECPDYLLQALQRIGKNAPMYCTGVGKCLLTEYDEKKLNNYLEVNKLDPLTKNTIVTKEKLIKELDKVRRQGYAEDNEECEICVRCIAAPLRNYSGKIIAAISTSGPVYRMTQEKREMIYAELIKTSTEISHKLGYEEAN